MKLVRDVKAVQLKTLARVALSPRSMGFSPWELSVLNLPPTHVGVLNERTSRVSAS
jgi:hypothetical protein